MKLADSLLSPVVLFLVLALHSRRCQSKEDALETVSDEELQKLITQENHVIVLFTHDDRHKECEAFETELAAIREDLVDSMNAWVVKAANSPLRKSYTPEAEPAIVFFRNQVPVLYDGSANDEEMLEILMRCKDTYVRELTDASFEHLTQAATGATTGDWFIMFHKDDCENCLEMRARLEALGCRHRSRGINIAMVNKGTHGAVTGRRFEVGAVPAFIFFRLGRMYRYDIGKYDLETLSSFVTGWYKNVQGESIPMPKSPFDDLVQMCADYIREYPLMVGFFAGLPVLLLIAFIYLTASATEKPKTKKKKKLKDTDKDK